MGIYKQLLNTNQQESRQTIGMRQRTNQTICKYDVNKY